MKYLMKLLSMKRTCESILTDHRGWRSARKCDRPAVRITHLPTGTVVACQNERSQHQNKDRAMQMLAAKLADLQRQEREAELTELAGEQRDVAWGSQIRSYVLHPLSTSQRSEI